MHGQNSFNLQIVMLFHVIAFQISNAFSAYQTHRFLVMFAMAKEELMLPGSVKRSLSGIIIFFDIRHSPEIHKFNVSCVEDDLLLSDVLSGFMGIEH